jgi:hypothetical protein
MRKIKLPQNSLHSGELTPNAYAQDGLAAYARGVKSLQNWNLLIEGGVERRWGTEWIATLPGEARTAPFRFNESQQYIFVFSNLRLDVYSFDDSDPDVLPVTTFVQTVTTNADWTTALLKTLRWASSGDTMFLCDGTGAQIMKEIERTSATTFTISDFAFEAHSSGAPTYQPYHKYAPAAMTLAAAATTGNTNVTTSDDYFTTSHVGAIIRYIGQEATITAWNSATNVDVTVLETFAGTAADTDWDIQVFNAENGYQMSVALAEQRMIIGGGKDFPHGIWMSKTGAFRNFDVGTASADEMIDRPLDSGTIETIRNIHISDNIEIFTDLAEHYIPLSVTQALTPTFSPVLGPQDINGISAHVPPQTYDGATVFMQQTGMVLREYLFNDGSDRYTSDGLSLLATHLFQNQDATTGDDTPADIRGSTVLTGTTRRPESYYFTVNVGKGEIVQFHSQRVEKIAGFGRWTTDGTFSDVMAVGNQLFCVVKREVAGDVWDAAFSDDFGRADTVYHLERFEPSFTLDHAAVSKNALPGKVFTGFSHLAGKTVHVTSRSALYHGTFTVASDGSITIAEDDTEITAGLDYTVSLKTLRPTFTAPGFTIFGEIIRLIAMRIQMSEAYSLQVAGTNKLIVKKVNDDFSLDPTAIAGIREYPLKGYSRDAEVELTQDSPLPLRILGWQLEIGI